MMIIIIAVCVAHFVDKAFNTVKESGGFMDSTITYFALALKASIIVMIAFIFYRLHKVVKGDPYLQLNNSLFRIHVTALFLYFFWWTAYEVSFEIWEFDENTHD